MREMITRSSIVKVVREGSGSVIIEAIVRELGGRQGNGAQGEKQNSLNIDFTVTVK